MKRMILIAGLFTIPSLFSHQPEMTEVKAAVDDPDPRLLRLQVFFATRNCPLKEAAADFLLAADRYALDWRLLPSISFIESSGGKDYHNNNVFGWDTPLQQFSSVHEGIHYVAAQLARAERYRNKSLDGKLRTYNPNPDYSVRVKAVMEALGPSDFGPEILD